MAVTITILGFRIDAGSYIEVVDVIIKWSLFDGGRYVCACNVHTLMEGYDSPIFSDVIGWADLAVPDGMPLVWLMRLKGKPNQQRVYGPTLMLQTLVAATRENIPVGFYGGEVDVLVKLVAAMQTRYEDLNVAYSFSPPYRVLSVQEDEVIINEINSSGARILFVGLGCPKQEIWMAEHRGRINAVMLGVGAAFDFHAGAKLQAPKWMQDVGLEWLFRLIAEPRRLWKRYLYHNPRFLILALADLLGLLKRES